MQGQCIVRLGDARVQAIGEHGSRAVDSFLRWLSDEHERALPLIFHRGEQLRRADQRCDVNVVSAGVHDSDVDASVVLGAHMACVWQSGLLVDRQRVHIGAHQHRRTRPIFHDRDKAVALPFRLGIFSDVLGDFVAEAAQFAGEQRRGFILVMGKLRSGMERLVSGNEGRQLLVDPGVQ